jgi:CheY-like chemotaxis protein
VATAGDALHALREAADAGHPFHLVLTDALMPGVDGYTLAEQIVADPRLSAVKIMLLTSAGSPALRGRRATLFAATLLKPLKQSELLDAIVTVFAAPDAPARRRRTKTPRRPRRTMRVLRVLVAEDNPTNQKLVSALLEQQGHTVAIVSNGRLAVERAAQEPFDLILMDVQMPEMSGLEAAAAIREAEQGTGRHIPIVALTARAMASDREQCLAAGMDAYVSKPVRSDELLSAIDTMTVSPTAGASPSALRSTPNHTPAGQVDLSALLNGFNGRTDLVKEVIDVFLTDAPAMLTRLKEAVHAWNATEVAAAAHAIKGSAGLFSQGEAYTQAGSLEQRARNGDREGADRACGAIERSVSGLMQELRQIRDRL